MTRSAYSLANPYSVGSTDYLAGINFDRMRKERLSKAQSALKKHGMAAALFVRHENIRYTVSVKGHAFCPQLSYALVFAENDPILYELGDMVEHQRLYCPWLKPENIRFSYSWLRFNLRSRRRQTGSAALCQSDCRSLEGQRRIYRENRSGRPG